jgi:galactokinase|tara:strand:- start:82 stop:1284 length:1203 start_codon:yes stop_codon:yes gene_type:complete
MHIAERCLTKFKTQFGQDAEASYFSPGRVNLLGEHTDYNGGWVLPAAVNLGTHFAVGKNNTNQLRVFSELLGPATPIELSEIASAKPQDSWQDYIAGVAIQLVPIAESPFGLDIYLTGDLPVGAGMSSSASLTTGLAVIFNDYWQLRMGIAEIAAVGQKAENDFVGLACGILDPFAIAAGAENHLISLDCSSLDYELVPFSGNKYQILVADTQVQRKLSDSHYNLRREECQRALQELQIDLDISSLSEASLDDLFNSGLLNKDEIAFYRARHVLAENNRVIASVDALKSGDMDRFGVLMNESHMSLRDDYEVSCEHLDIMVDEANSLPGILGAKMTGAGFGGCVVAICEADRVEWNSAKLAEAYLAKSGITPKIYLVKPSQGAGISDPFDGAGAQRSGLW